MKFNLKKFLKNLKLNEENISMIFGGLVVVIMGILIVNYFKDRGGEVVSVDGSKNNSISVSEYEVKKGDSLWSIAENKLESGFRWEELKTLNNLATNTIEIGQKLNIPSDTIDTVETKVISDEYTVVRGDTLWDIAVFAYGDGYRWSDIARENNLSNPNLIHAGNVLKLPR